MSGAIIILLGLIGAAFFAMSETAFVVRLYRYTAGKASWWQQNPEQLLVTTLVGTNISIVVAASVATEMALKVMGGYAEILVTVVFSVVSLIFCETIPKSIALQKSDKIIPWANHALLAFRAVAYPVVYAASAFSRFVTKVFERIGTTEYAPQPAELIEVLRNPIHGLDRGRLTALAALLRFAKRRVLDVMTPVSQIPVVNLGAPAREAHEKLRNGIGYVAVSKDDKLIGVLDVTLCGKIPLGEPINADRISTLFVPENKEALEFVHETRDKNFPPALVVDEFGNVTGAFGGYPIVRWIFDFGAVPSKKALQYPGASLVIRGDTPMETLELMTGERFPVGAYQTVAGFIIEKLRKIPRPGDVLVWEPLKFTVVAADQKKIVRVRVERISD
ncbi:DUF21 domain-containing protein [bacterium]|nr:DUF21 domain-containing protein [bacterium]